MMLNNTDGDIFWNSFSGNGTGFSTYNFASPSFTIVETELFGEPNNVMENNSYACYVGSSAAPDFGTYYVSTYTYGGFTSFYHSSGGGGINNQKVSAVKAEVNWFENIYHSGTIDVTPDAESLGFYLSKSTENENQYDPLLTKAYQFELDSNYVEAIQAFTKLGEIAADDPMCQYAVAGIRRNYNRIEDYRGLIAALDDMFYRFPEQQVGVSALDVSVSVLANLGDFDEALSRSRKVIGLYQSVCKNDECAAWALFEQAAIINLRNQKMQQNGLAKSSPSDASRPLTLLLSLYPNSEAAGLIDRIQKDLIPIAKDQTISTPEKFTLHSAYPNPFNPITTICYDLPEDSKVKITIFDLTGRLVMELINENRSAGYHTLQWDASNLSSGVYLYRMQAGNFSDMKKCLLVK